MAAARHPTRLAAGHGRSPHPFDRLKAAFAVFTGAPCGGLRASG